MGCGMAAGTQPAPTIKLTTATIMVPFDVMLANIATAAATGHCEPTGLPGLRTSRHPMPTSGAA